MKRLFLLAPLTAACTSSPATPIPTASIDGATGAIGEHLSRQAEKPCGYTLAYDSADASGATHQDIVDAIVYDGSGRDVAEHAVDAHSGAKAIDETSTYDAAGNWVTFADHRYDGTPDSAAWAVYDSFERLVRYSGDDTGDGTEDWVATYTYGGDGRRATAHLVLPTVTYDRAYHYGADGRLSEVDRDDGPDGHVDRITTYTYDDDARVETRTIVGPSGTPLGSGTTTYDDDDRVLTDETIEIDPTYTADTTEAHVYDGDREVSDTWGTRYTESSGATSSFGDALIWRYGGCN